MVIRLEHYGKNKTVVLPLFMKNSSPNVTLGVGPNIAAANSTVIKTGIVQGFTEITFYPLKVFHFSEQYLTLNVSNS